MEWMTKSDFVLLAIGVYVAVTSLVRMMRRRQDEVVAGVRRQLVDHRKRTKKRPAAPEETGRGAA